MRSRDVSRSHNWLLSRNKRSCHALGRFWPDSELSRCHHRSDVDRDAIRSDRWHRSGARRSQHAVAGRSLVSEVVGVIWVLIIGYALGTASHSLSIGSEILSRTSPTVLDLLIGLVGGPLTTVR